jgi:hypothetical protein
LCAILGLIGCGTATFIVQQYDGSPLPRERIALLRLNGGDPLRLEVLDGERLDYQVTDTDTRVHIEILPGVHEIGVGDPSTGLLLMQRFRADAGKVYRFAITARGADAHGTFDPAFHVLEVDRDDDHVLAEVPEYKPPAKKSAVASSAGTTPAPSIDASPTALSVSAIPSSTIVPSASVTAPTASVSAAPLATGPAPTTTGPIPAPIAASNSLKPAAAPSASAAPQPSVNPPAHVP